MIKFLHAIFLGYLCGGFIHRDDGCYYWECEKCHRRVTMP